MICTLGLIEGFYNSGTTGFVVEGFSKATFLSETLVYSSNGGVYASIFSYRDSIASCGLNGETHTSVGLFDWYCMSCVCGVTGDMASLPE